MKKIFAIFTTLFALTVFSCSDIETQSKSEPESIPEGYGKVVFTIEGENARTIRPYTLPRTWNITFEDANASSDSNNIDYFSEVSNYQNLYVKTGTYNVTASSSSSSNTSITFSGTQNSVTITSGAEVSLAIAVTAPDGVLKYNSDFTETETVTTGTLDLTITLDEDIDNFIYRNKVGAVFTANFASSSKTYTLTSSDLDGLSYTAAEFSNDARRSAGKLKLSLSDVPQGFYLLDIQFVIGSLTGTYTVALSDSHFQIVPTLTTQAEITSVGYISRTIFYATNATSSYNGLSKNYRGNLSDILEKYSGSTNFQIYMPEITSSEAADSTVPLIDFSKVASNAAGYILYTYNVTNFAGGGDGSENVMIIINSALKQITIQYSGQIFASNGVRVPFCKFKNFPTEAGETYTVGYKGASDNQASAITVPDAVDGIITISRTSTD